MPVIVEEACTGCALCHAVCPVEGAIDMVIRKTEFKIDRGIDPKVPPKGMYTTIYP